MVQAQPQSTRERQIEAERLLLSALCQRSLPESTQEDVLRNFAKRKFAHPEHQLVFWALSKLLAKEPAVIQELLAARLTLLGFPDLDFKIFFESPVPAPTEIPALLQLL